MAIIIGVLMAVIILLAVAIFLIVSRHRQRKCFASPLVGKSALATGNGCPGMSSGSSCGTGGSYKEAGTGSSVSQHHGGGGGGGGHQASSANGHLHDMDRLIQLDAEPYQEPYHAHHAPFYSYSTVVVGGRDTGSEYNNYYHNPRPKSSLQHPVGTPSYLDKIRFYTDNMKLTKIKNRLRPIRINPILMRGKLDIFERQIYRWTTHPFNLLVRLKTNPTS